MPKARKILRFLKYLDSGQFFDPKSGNPVLTSLVFNPGYFDTFKVYKNTQTD